MPRTALTITPVTRAGIAPPTQNNSDPANNHSLAYNSGGIIIEAQNTHATLARVVTVETPGVVDGLAVADLTVSVAATTTRLIGPFPPGVYNQGDGTVNINIDGSAADVKFRAYSLF